MRQIATLFEVLQTHRCISVTKLANEYHYALSSMVSDDKFDLRTSFEENVTPPYNYV